MPFATRFSIRKLLSSIKKVNGSENQPSSRSFLITKTSSLQIAKTYAQRPTQKPLTEISEITPEFPHLTKIILA